MRAISRAVAILGAGLAALLAALVLGLWIRYGGGDRFPDRTSIAMVEYRGTQPSFSTSSSECGEWNRVFTRSGN